MSVLDPKSRRRSDRVHAVHEWRVGRPLHGGVSEGGQRLGFLRPDMDLQLRPHGRCSSGVQGSNRRWWTSAADFAWDFPLVNPLLFAVLSSHSGAGISVTGASGALPAHPRVMMNTTRATFVQLQYANNTTRWQNIKTAVDAQLAAGGTYTAGDEVTLWSLACAYLAGYNASSVAARVGVILTGYCISGNDRGR